MRTSLVIPCYNESAGLPSLVKRCREVVRNIDGEIVLVDNRSTDATPSVLPELLKTAPGCRLISVEKNQGYGHGILSGLAAANGDILAWTHADMQTDPMDLVAALQLMK